MAALSVQSSLHVQTGTQHYSQVLPDLERMISIFAGYPEIQAVYLFGSTSTGRTHAESDLDLAIVLRPDADSLSKLDILTKLAQAGFCNVDLVTLDTDDIVLKHEAVRQNRLIYRTDEFDRGAFFSKIIRQFCDFRPFLDVQRRAYKQRTLNDQA